MTRPPSKREPEMRGASEAGRVRDGAPAGLTLYGDEIVSFGENLSWRELAQTLSDGADLDAASLEREGPGGRKAAPAPLPRHPQALRRG